MKRPPVRGGVGKPTPAKPRPVDANPAPVKAQPESTPAKAPNVISIAAERAKRKKLATQKAPKASKAQRFQRAPKAPRVAANRGAKLSFFSRASKSARTTFLTRLGPEAARFRAYSRRRRAILISVVGSFMSLILLMLAAMFTPMLAVEEIKVIGLNRLKETQIQKALKSQLGTPLPLVSSEAVGQALSPYSLIESFSITSRPPHTLQVTITERTPICVVNLGGVPYLFDPAGVRIGKAADRDQYPRLAINGNPSSSKEYALAIDVLLALPASLLPRVESIDAKSKDNVTMVLRGAAGQEIVWGDASESVLKSKVLAALIKNHKKSDRVTFDVSSPEAPVVRY